ncbi:MAG: DNA polymerase II large subunit [Candidatus Thorarchaeota archaeon]
MTESEPSLPKHSINYSIYFKTLTEELERIYVVAEVARSKGYDPSEKVEIPPAHDVAARVEATLDGPVGVAKRIRELQEDLSREDVAFAIAKEIALGELGGITDREKAADKAVRVALAILTESITAAPLEGISKVRIRGSGSEQYLALYLAGPIRAAGGTEAAVTVLVADYVRQVLELPALVSTEEEVERALEEVELYARSVHLQYSVTPELVRFAASNLPIMLTGDPTESFEVSAGRDLGRIETNRVRGGSVLVLNDGVVGRAAKLAKIVHRVNIPGWEWLDEIAEKTSKAKSSETEDTADKKLEPKSDYLADVIGGRPVFSHPSRIGGFRLRYGRSRNTGLAGVGVHPATMLLVNGFLAPGTHIRTERPGKGSIVAPVDTIEGPIVRLKDGTVRQIHTYSDAKSVEDDVEHILYLGDILVGLGEFLENNHPLVPSGYCEEWWSHDLEQACSQISKKEMTKLLDGSDISPEELNAYIETPLTKIPSPTQSIILAQRFKIPLHPRYLYRWLASSTKDVISLRNWILEKHKIEKTSEGRFIILPKSIKKQAILEKIGIPHKPHKSKTICLLDDASTIFAQLGKKDIKANQKNALEMLNSVAAVELRDKAGFNIGARMGRPEKAEERKMRPPVQVLFPVGRKLGSERRVERVASSVQYIATLDLFDNEPEDTFDEPIMSGLELDLVTRSCPKCANETFESRCPKCGTHTEVKFWCAQEDCGLNVDEVTGMCPRGHDINLVRATKKVPVDIQKLLDRIKDEINEPQTYDLRGVLGLTSELKIPEYLGKGILRAKHDVYCYRDGTARFDATDAPLTHFTPNEVGVPFWRIRELGYLTDYQGEELTSDDQILELKVQDIIVPERCADFLVRVGQFVDDCLEQIYGIDRYYHFKAASDVLGQLVIGLAPHTSAGIVGRVVGFTTASVCYAHPYWHAAKRRNCDGDEDALILILDALINFSRAYLPKGRGGFMDAPLVLSVILNPLEVDDESHNVEVCARYPAQFYQMVSEAQHPKIVEHLVDILHSRLNTEAQYEGFGFTHGTTSIDAGPKNSMYKILDSMVEKLEAQLKLAQTIEAVDAQDVAERVISHHFLRDIRGNLRAYSTQKIQCLKCHTVYRRIPLSGKCEKCGNMKLSLTVRQKNISKYLEITEKMIDTHDLGTYLRQRLQLINTSLNSLFISEQTTLSEFF